MNVTCDPRKCCPSNAEPLGGKDGAVRCCDCEWAGEISELLVVDIHVDDGMWCPACRSCNWEPTQGP